MEKIFKKAVLILFLMLLVLPALQFKFNFVKMQPLGGDYKFAPRPAFSIEEWDSAYYQKKYTEYVNDHIGFREFFLRSYNQVWFSLFRVVHVQDLIVGKNLCLYERNYINDFTGISFRGEQVIEEQLRKARIIQDSLQKRNIKLILYFAPGKASFFPENIPEKYLEKSIPQTNYKCYTQKCKKMGLNYFDMNSYFISQKEKSEYSLYNYGGIHWSLYGMTIAFDSLCRYMGNLQGAPLPHLVIDEVVLSDTARETDNDIEKALNLLFDLPHKKYAYPKVRFVESAETIKPRVLVVADSYWWNVFGSGYTSKAFGGSSFWYYNEQAYNDMGMPEARTDTMDFKNEVNKYQFVILLSTEANLYRFGYNFIERLYNIYAGNGDPIADKRRFEEAVVREEKVIRGEAGWLEIIRKKAIQENIPIDSAIRENAVYMVNQRQNK